MEWYVQELCGVSGTPPDEREAPEKWQFVAGYLWIDCDMGERLRKRRPSCLLCGRLMSHRKLGLGAVVMVNKGAHAVCEAKGVALVDEINDIDENHFGDDTDLRRQVAATLLERSIVAPPLTGDDTDSYEGTSFRDRSRYARRCRGGSMLETAQQ
jgi:hypothetical protein